MKIQKTFVLKNGDRQPEWVLIDAKNQILGRLAVQIADILRGKDRPEYTPHLVSGRGVVVINAAEIKTTGIKEFTKEYVRHSGYRGGDSYTSLREMLAKKPTAVIEMAVKGMLPKNRLQAEFMKKLRVFPTAEHTLTAQQPTPIN